MRLTILTVLSLLVAFNVVIGSIVDPVWWFLLLSVTLPFWSIRCLPNKTCHFKELSINWQGTMDRRGTKALHPAIYHRNRPQRSTSFPRMFRSIVYQRAKNSRETVPFGTQLDTYKDGYEWIGHSLSAREVEDMDEDPRVTVGGLIAKSRIVQAF